MDAAKKAFSILEEFKGFAFKGNVVDLSVGVIIGGAFGKIVEALVKSVIMPLIGALLPGEQGYLGWKLLINGKEVPYGVFIGEVVNFLIVSLAVFFGIVKFLGFLFRSKESGKVTPPKPTVEEQLLTEIRDILRARGE
jgi:large conductance mechanosensitive channel